MKIKKIKVMPLVLSIVMTGSTLTLASCGAKEEKVPATPIVKVLEENKDATFLDEGLMEREVTLYEANTSYKVSALEGLEDFENILNLYLIIDEIENQPNIEPEVYDKTKLELYDEEIIYVVQPGDTLDSIAKKTGVTVEQLRTDNMLESYDIMAGDELLIINNPQLFLMPISEAELLGEEIASDNTPLARKKAAMGKLHLQKLAIEKWLKVNGNCLMENISLTAIKSSVVDAYGFGADKIDDVKLCSEKDNVDSFHKDIRIWEDNDVVIKANLENKSALSYLQDVVYYYQSNPTMDEITKKDINRYKETIKMINELILSDKYVDDGIFSDTIKLR